MDGCPLGVRSGDALCRGEQIVVNVDVRSHTPEDTHKLPINVYEAPTSAALATAVAVGDGSRPAASEVPTDRTRNQAVAF